MYFIYILTYSIRVRLIYYISIWELIQMSNGYIELKPFNYDMKSKVLTITARFGATPLEGVAVKNMMTPELYGNM